MAKPWLTSDGLIGAVKRKISFPISQVTFTEADILAFANEEMMISQVPAVMEYHEEYFTYTLDVPLEAGKSKYEIPDRAIGLKLRDVFFIDSQGNLIEMTRISQDDRAYYQSSDSTTSQSLQKFYLEGNNIVITPEISGVPTGSLKFVFFLRPNQLVRDAEAAIVRNFTQTITTDNANIVAGDTVTIQQSTPTTGGVSVLNSVILTAVAAAPSTNEFLIGATSVITATNLATAINTEGTYSATNGTPSTNIVTVTYNKLNISVLTSKALGFVIPDTISIVFTSIPTAITEGQLIDFLQTGGGHKTYSYNITIPTGGISGTTITFSTALVPEDLVIGDYICLEQECIIPQIPSDLHNGLAERTCVRILSAMGDLTAVQTKNQHLQEIRISEGNLLDNRVEGAPQKVANRHSLLRYGKIGKY